MPIAFGQKWTRSQYRRQEKSFHVLIPKHNPEHGYYTVFRMINYYISYFTIYYRYLSLKMSGSWARGSSDSQRISGWWSVYFIFTRSMTNPFRYLFGKKENTAHWFMRKIKWLIRKVFSTLLITQSALKHWKLTFECLN